MNENTENIKRGRGRPPNSKNRKFCVRLKDLCAALNPEFQVPVSKELAMVLKASDSGINIMEMEDTVSNTISDTPQREPKIDFSVIGG